MIKIDFKIIQALFARDIRRYFTNPIGYTFITLFIFLSAVAAFWQDRFFLNNLANLDLLNDWFPYLLLIFIPALTMGVWAEERKQATDELLLTIPATDLEVVLGKYLAALGVYTASLVLSASHVLILLWLGSPDLGLMFGNYFGYWLIGAAFIAVGMLASMLSSNVTIAFILGAVFCSVFVFMGSVAAIFGDFMHNTLTALVVFGPFGDFARGVISFSGILYFTTLGATLLYINVLLLGKRHWPLEADGHKMWVHHAVRTAAIVIAVISLNVILGRLNVRLDVTAEQMNSLSEETKRLLNEMTDNATVFVQAYVSKEVPQHYVQARTNLLDFLHEIDAHAGEKVQLLIHDTEPFTEEARDAREKFGIMPRNILEQESARANLSSVFMGVAFTSGAREEVIPFFDRGLPTEYELVRSIRVVAGTERKKIGVITTQAKIFGGLDFQTMQSTPSWQVVEELKKQYDVIEISAGEPIFEELDGILVILPSSLPQAEMDNVLDYIAAGTPALLLVDPMPYFNVGLAPAEESGANQNPFMNQGAPPEPKGDISSLMTFLGVNWNPAQVVWDVYNPHPDLAQLPLEFVFLGAGNEDAVSFNPDLKASAKLQEVLLLFPGSISVSMNSDYEFQPLLKSGTTSGTLMYYQMIQRSFFGTQLVFQSLPHYPNDADYVLAAQIKSIPSPDDSIASGFNTNVIVIADIDFISDQFFMIRKEGFENLNFDNVSFFLNSMDILVGDESFIDLRNRRVKHRTLETVEARTREFIEKSVRDKQDAEAEAQMELAEAQRRLNEKVEEVQQRTDLDVQAKQIMANSIREVENKRYETLRTNIEANKELKIQSSKEDMESQIRNIQGNIRIVAILAPPIPVFIIGFIIFMRRQRREQESAVAARRLRSSS